MVAALKESKRKKKKRQQSRYLQVWSLMFYAQSTSTVISGKQSTFNCQFKNINKQTKYHKLTPPPPTPPPQKKNPALSASVFLKFYSYQHYPRDAFVTWHPPKTKTCTHHVLHQADELDVAPPELAQLVHHFLGMLLVDPIQRLERVARVLAQWKETPLHNQ